MDLGIYAHPWDLRALPAHGGLRRLADLGFRDVALAVSYHAGRWLTPWQPDSRVRFLEDGTVHYRPRANYGRLVPLPSCEVREGEPTPLEWLCEHAAEHGLRARAWAVLTHNTRLGEQNRDCCVQNAFGDAYTYSLCHGNEHVQCYAQAMVSDLRAHRGLHAIELEAILSLGHRHSSHHDKNSFPADAFIDVLMSACFCDSCIEAMATMKVESAPLGHDAIVGLRRKIRVLLEARFAEDCMAAVGKKASPQQLVERLRAELGPAALALLGARTLSLMKLLLPMQKLGVGAPILCAQANYDSLRGNAALPFPIVGGFVQECAMTVYGEKAAEVASALPHLLAANGDGVVPPRPVAQRPSLRLCLHPRAPQYQTDDDLRLLRDLCAQHGIHAVSIYHLGLLPWRTIERVAKAFS